MATVPAASGVNRKPLSRKRVLRAAMAHADKHGLQELSMRKLAEVLVGGARIGRGAQMQADLLATGIQITQHDRDEPLRLAELRARTGLKLPDCCVLETAISNNAAVATFDHRSQFDRLFQHYLRPNPTDCRQTKLQQI